MKLAYYPGCSAKGSSLDYELSSQAVCKVLGIQAEEIKDWNCCGSTPAHAVSTELSAALCTRNLSLAAKQGADTVVTPCPSCLSNLLHARQRMENPEFRDRVNGLLDEPAPEKLPETISVMQCIGRLKRKAAIESAAELEKTPLSNVGRYSARTLPAAGALLRGEDVGETQMKLDI